MGTREYSRYYPPFAAMHRNGSSVTSGEDSALANAVISTYADTRRNVIAYTANTSGVIILPSVDTDTWHELVNIPVGGRLVPGWTFTLYMRYLLSSALAANTARWQVELTGIGVSEIDGLTSTSATLVSHTIAVAADAAINNNTRLIVRMRSDAVNTMTVYSISSGQNDDYSALWTDVDAAACKIGDDDWSHNALAMKILRENVVAVRHNRTPRANVYCHWYRKYHKNGGYNANSDDLGNYRIKKRPGTATVWVHFLMQTDDTTDPSTVKLTASNTVEGSVTQSVTGMAGAPFWCSKAFTFNALNTLRGCDIELKIDADDGAYTIETYIMGICVTERPLDTSAISHTVPNLLNTTNGSDIHASELDNMRTTCDHLYRRGGAAILLADYRFGSPDVSYDERLYANKTAIDKVHYGYSSTSVICRALAYPSTSSTRWRVRMGYESSAGSSHKKYIMFQCSDSLTAGTYDDAGPMTSTNKWYEFTTALDGEDVKEFDLDITAGDWETPSSRLGPGDVPMQLWIFGWSANAAEYVMPKWVTIEEIALTPTEFP